MNSHHPPPADPPTADPAPARPLLRGWSHAIAALGAIPALAALLWQALPDPPRAVSLLVYGVSMIQLLTVSASYHLHAWRPPVRAVLRALDHASIFLLIAGTYTPIAVNVLAGWERVAVLATVWALAAVGVACSLFTPRLPRWARTGLYLALGWVALLPAPSLVRALPALAVAGLLAGGLFYTAGALVYARRWPDPLPRVFGFHEVFHLLVLAGAATFAATIWIWIVPYPRA
ncbi:MAG TPA: hemolysin III family protein [Chloroflexota bacterium]|nr:hemolysin III family protein [Chloroflexota bacterium]